MMNEYGELKSRLVINATCIEVALCLAQVHETCYRRHTCCLIKSMECP